MDARIKSGHDGCVSWNEVKERFAHTPTSSFQTAKTISHARSRPRGAKRPRRCYYLPPKKGVGNAGCPMHPRPRVHFVVVERTRVTTSTPESPGIPARNGFNSLCRALPVTGL